MAAPKFIQAKVTSLLVSITAAETTEIKLKNLQDLYGNNLAFTDFETTGYMTIDPGGDNEEIISFTGFTVNSDDTVSIDTGITRGLVGKSPYGAGGTASAHAAGVRCVISNNPQMYDAIIDYIDGIAIAGVGDASESAKGIVEEATQAEVDAKTATGSTGAQLFVPPDKLRTQLYNDYVADTGAADTYAIAPSPAITAYAAGQEFTFKATNANTGASTLNVNALGAKDMKKRKGRALESGDIQAGQIIKCVYDGTNMEVVSPVIDKAPEVVVFDTESSILGDATTQFDVTDQGSNTFRYTYDGTGTDPSITSSNPATGDGVYIYATNMASGNEGAFIVTASDTNYFEVTNASGVAESDKTLAVFDGLQKVAAANLWTKDTGLKYVVVELVGGGGGGSGGNNTPSPDVYGAGGGSGGYSRKLIAASSLGSTEVVCVGKDGAKGTAATAGSSGAVTAFGDHCYGTGALTSGNHSLGGNGGTASGGDLNIDGQDARDSDTVDVSDDATSGGSNPLGVGGGTAGAAANGYGAGGAGGSEDDGLGGTAGQGIVIVTEYYE